MPSAASFGKSILPNSPGSNLPVRVGVFWYLSSNKTHQNQRSDFLSWLASRFRYSAGLVFTATHNREPE
jgi:hypothetical protein